MLKNELITIIGNVGEANLFPVGNLSLYTTKTLSSVLLNKHDSSKLRELFADSFKTIIKSYSGERLGKNYKHFDGFLVNKLNYSKPSEISDTKVRLHSVCILLCKSEFEFIVRNNKTSDSEIGGLLNPIANLLVTNTMLEDVIQVLEEDAKRLRYFPDDYSLYSLLLE